ncbi:Hsp20/alpha crystallin family protein [Desulfococcus multivorans]|uniref:Heat shock protein Hsp20 n=2 Tax=Desulfococcus TaxID=896 RepID=S7T7A2_DESML|nr:Hsp20/alpha crystallin family protein [Desulfococcus multivorans]AOY60510.1 heat shock protein, Hsp 20 family [Desulfococcus multivorans]AQV02608.1 heat-shock protein Hsp20 [Desulfococcus multivorans]EPR32461.1 heat shock protein Hsp20 [Desulfococcus multivorans DSM 2059]MDX9817904.1 Hsp20/alpha crystallin family protein [Desulfococcus multivorans]SKA24550.1 HSP20 family protein [Desulfococcus multivorans DSM 2059]
MTARRLFDFPGLGWRNPFAELERMQREMDRLFGDQFFRSGWPGLHAGVFPSVNVTEDQDHFYIRSELPGMAADDLDIQAAGNSVTISGERRIPAEGDNVRYHRREREAGKFSRIVTLPNGADMDKVSAGLTNGVLTVTIAKSEATKPRQISIK